MLNQWQGMGRLTRDPELRSTVSGIAVASFSLAIDRDYKDKNGEKQTDFVPVVAWQAKADFARKYLKKGQLVIVTGRLTQNNWMDNNGNKRTSWQVVADNLYFAGSRKTDDSAPPAEPKFSELDDDGEKLPF